MAKRNDPRLVLGLKVRNLRSRRGETLRTLADRAGLSVSYLSEIEKGKKYPKPETLMRLAQALEIPFDELVSLRVAEVLDPLKEAFRSPLLREFPFDLFGLEPEDLLALVSDEPKKGGALLRALREIGRTYDVHVEHFLLAALRAYQQLNGNYFEELERHAVGFRRQQGWAAEQRIEAEPLAELLRKRWGYRIDTQRLSEEEELRFFRSVYSNGVQPTLYINPRLLPSQQAFVLAREVGYRQLELSERAVTSSWLKIESFSQLFNNFKASYFAGALLIDESAILADLRELFRSERWVPRAVAAGLDRYGVTPETMLHRLTQVAPRAFSMGEFYFLRFSNAVGDDRMRLTKWLNTSRVPVPHGISLSEHYCRRWPAARALARLRNPDTVAGLPVVTAQRSRFLAADAEFFVITMARPLSLRPGTNSGVSVGFLLNDSVRRTVRFWNDSDLPRVDVNLTCERCPLDADQCADRVAAPGLHELLRDRDRRTAAVERLLQSSPRT